MNAFNLFLKSRQAQLKNIRAQVRIYFHYNMPYKTFFLFLIILRKIYFRITCMN